MWTWRAQCGHGGHNADMAGSTSPRVFLINNFLSAFEADHIINATLNEVYLCC